jgi:hypothetical protein
MFMFLIAIFLLLISQVTFAGNIYPDYLNNNHNYILCDGHMGTGWYVIKDSLRVEKYDPPRYIITVNIAQVPDADKLNTRISRVFTNRYFYNYSMKEMYVERNGTWKHINPNDPWAETGISMPAGEIAFYIAYHMMFYGQFYDKYDDAFYLKI